MRLILLLAFLAASALAQSQAQLTGIVRDPAGAVAPNAKVTLLNIATGVEFTAQSNQDGIYRFLSLPPAQYKATCSLAGFKTFERSPVTLQVADIVDLNITLQVGDASERVVVTAQVESLQTQTATVGAVVTTREIESLPLNVRDPLALVGLTPGVTFGANFGNGGGQELGRNFFKSDFNVGGGRSGTQELLLDSAPNTTADVNRGIINPPVDSVQEFKVQTNSYDAEYGRTTGGVVNVVTKSGSNDFHGLAYLFERHSYIEANNWFNNRAGIPNPSFKRHQIGGNVSGPIVKNKTFFFADYEGLRQGFPITFVSTVPNELQRAGNFSQTASTIYDFTTLTTLASGQRQRAPFPGNIVPDTRQDPVAKKIVSYYPLANQPGFGGQQNYVRSAGSNINTDKWDARGDHTFNQNTRLFGRYSEQKDIRTIPGPLAGAIGGGRTTTDTYHQAVLDGTRVLSPNLIATAQVAFSRALAAQYGLSKGFDIASLGFPAAFTRFATDQFPQGGVADFTALSNGSDSFIQYQPRNAYTTRGGMAYTRGTHTMKWGADFRILQFNEGQNTQPSGTFNFGRTFSQGPNPVQASRDGGLGLADLLLGTPASGAIRQLMPISTGGRYYATYVQDDWRVSSKLTVNLGIRWDVGTGNSEKYGRIAYFDPTGASPLAGPAGLPNLKGLLRWVGGDGPANTQSTPLGSFAPRLGLAYKIGSNGVLRAGYGMFFIPRNIQGNGNGAVAAFRDTPMNTTIDGGLTPADRLSNPYPQGILPTINNRDPLTNAGATVQGSIHGFKNGYGQLFSFGYQHQLKGNVLVQANYWGNRGVSLLAGPWNLNQLPNQYLALGNQLNTQVRNPFQGLIAIGGLSGPTISTRQSLLPYPQYVGDGGVQQVLVPAGNSTYHALTLQADKRLSQSLTFMTSFTWSKAIDDISAPIDFYNRRLNKALSAFDTPAMFVGSWVYNLPVGKGRHYLSSLPAVANGLLGGWDLSGIARIQSGQPVAIGTPAVNVGRGAKLDSPTIQRWFDTSAFTVAQAFTFGNLGPRLPDVRNDFTRNLDVVLVKNFHTPAFGRELVTQFRAECYNLTNTPQFGGPNGAVTSPNFGIVTAQRNTSRQFQFALKVRF